ncbi:MAG: ABC transporter substrate-binding protein [Clostridia bacterium]|jgi:peptide/nickel transport system substrate-binding protein|nr:ABC transporter substrate-binding protein [Clostridia bacterium]MDH7573833.1 ABC transporter substrate-binding protein [Clostridia bacterium]
MRIKVPALTLVAVLTAFSLLAAGCGSEPASSSQTETPAAQEVAELRLPGGDWGLPTPFTFYPRGPGYVHLSLVYDTLIWKDDKGVIPWLAEKWEPDAQATAWTFILRPGLKWQDGQPLTARDVVFTFEYLKQHPVEWFNLGMIRSVEARDERTVVFTLKQPYMPFLQQVAGNVPVIPEHIWSQVADPRQEARPELVLGSGPYRLVSYDQSQGAYAYEANPDFFLGPPRVKKLLFVPAGDQVAALQRGDVHAADIPATLAEQFRQDQRFEVISGPAFWVLKLQFNLDKAPFADVRVRQALAYAIDREEMVRRAVPGGTAGAKPGSPGFLPPDSSWHDPEAAALYPPDPDKARALLKEAGIFDRNGDGLAEDAAGKPLRLTLLALADYTREAEVLKLMLREAGLECEVKALETKTLDGLIQAGQYDLALTGHGGLGGDPAIISGFGVFRGGALSPGTPTEAAYGGLAQQLLREPQAERRREICRQMQKLYAQSLPCLPLYYPVWYFACDHRVFSGWFFTAEGGIAVGIPMFYNKLAFVGRQ